jgi:hypothetical protein
MIELRRWLLAVLALAAVVAWSAQARPEEGKEKKGKKGGQSKLIAEEGAIEMMLLGHKSVQDDLMVSEANRKKISDFANKQWKKAKEVAAMPKGKQNEEWQALEKENEKFLKDTLSEKQRKRLDQIGMQEVGLLWVTRKDIAKELKITKEQRKELHEARHKAHQEFSAIVNSEETTGVDAKLKKLREKNQKRLMDLLTAEQKTKWKDLAGEKFKGDLSKDE